MTAGTASSSQGRSPVPILPFLVVSRVEFLDASLGLFYSLPVRGLPVNEIASTAVARAFTDLAVPT